jgi:type II secretion system protein H
MKLAMTNDEFRMAPRNCSDAPGFHPSSVIRHSQRGFTLIELILVLALLVIITSIAAPAMSRFVRGRALDSEARRLAALMHAAQARAVSEGAPMIFWVDEKAGSYGLAAETSGQNGDPKAEELAVDSTLAIAVVSTASSSEELAVDSTLAIAVVSTGAGVQTTFNNLPAIKFLADGTVDENSPRTLKLTDSDGFSRWMIETKLRTGYEISSTAN